MATKQKTKALKVLNWDFKKGEKNNMLPMVIQERHWVVCTPNKTDKGGDFEYKDDSFTLDILNGTGFADSKGDKWLLACLDWANAKEIVEIAAKDWSDKWEVNKEKTDEAIEPWKATGCLTAIKCNTFPQLEMMAELLNGISFEYREAKIDFTVEADAFDKDACKWFIDIQSELGDVPKLSRTEKDKSVIKNVKACQSVNFLPTINITDPSDFSDFMLPFAFKETEEGEADYPYLKIDWVPPVIEERKSGGNWNNGSTVNVSQTSPKDRLEFCYEFTGTNTPEDLVNADSKTLLTALLLTGVSPSDAYVSLLTRESHVSEVPNKVSVPQTNNGASEVKKPELQQNNNNGNSLKSDKIEPTDYTHLINEWAIANPNKLSPELELTDKSDSWKRMFYSLLTGAIGKKPLLGADGRSNTVMIKKEFGKKLHELDETELGKLVEKLDSKHKESSDLEAVNF